MYSKGIDASVSIGVSRGVTVRLYVCVSACVHAHLFVHIQSKLTTRAPQQTELSRALMSFTLPAALEALFDSLTATHNMHMYV